MNSKFYNLFIRNWFGTKGRASRQEFICRFTMMWILGFTNIAYYKIDDSLDYSELTIIVILSMLLIVFLGSIFILSVAQVFFLTHRRLHDLNASGWWQLITFIPCGQILMLGFIFFKGTQGTNKYGAEPKY